MIHKQEIVIKKLNEEDLPKPFTCIICKSEFDWYGGDYICPDCQKEPLNAKDGGQ